MSLKKSLMDCFAGKYDVQDKSAVLDNEFVITILDREWLIEIDRDGANAVTVSPIKEIKCPYLESHQIVVLQSVDNDSEGNTQRHNGEVIEAAILMLNGKLFQCDKE